MVFGSLAALVALEDAYTLAKSPLNFCGFPALCVQADLITVVPVLLGLTTVFGFATKTTASWPISRMTLITTVTGALTCVGFSILFLRFR